MTRPEDTDQRSELLLAPDALDGLTPEDREAFLADLADATFEIAADRSDGHLTIGVTR